MATAVLENINPYSKYGLKRRPTYEEIIGLIGENETLTGTLPDRTATRFKASQEGSFFDGMDSLELLKEQQNRIHERQMRELIMRQNLGGGTYNVARLQQQRREVTQPELELQRDDNLHEASIQTSLQERARQAVEREQQTGDAHRQGFLSGLTTPIIERISGITTPQRPIPQLPHHRQKPTQVSSDVEEISSGEMLTARNETESSQSEPTQEILKTITYKTNVSKMSEKALKFQLFIRGVDVDDPETNIQTRQRGSKGDGMTPKQFYVDLARKMIDDGRWQTKVSEELLKKRIQDYRNKNQPRGSKD